MSSIMTPDNIHAAVESLTNELPSLIGEDWELLKDDFHLLKQKLHDSNNPEERDRLASELIDILIPYKDARDSLNEHIRLQHIRAVLRDTIEIDIPAFAAKMGLDNKVVEPSVAIVMKSIVVDLEEAEARLIEIKEGGIEPAKSVKIRNFHLGYFWETHPDGKIRTFKFIFLLNPRCFNQWWEAHFCDLVSFGNKFSL